MYISKIDKKKELHENLPLAMVDMAPILSTKRPSAAPKGFEKRSRWILMGPEEEGIPAPINKVATAYTPNDRHIISNHDTKKFNHNNVRERPPFTVTKNQVLLSSDKLMKG